MKISKTDGVWISLIMMSPYVFMYGQWVKNSSYSTQLIGIFFVGIFLHFLRKIESGTHAELLFFEKSTGHFWSDGFCLVPSVLPALHNVGIYLLWNLKKDMQLLQPNFNPNVTIHHFKDQRLPVYRVNTDTSLLALSIHNTIGKMFAWFFAPIGDDSELKYQKLGFRIILISLILGWGGNTFFPKEYQAQQSDRTDFLTSFLNWTENKVAPKESNLQTAYTPQEIITEVHPGQCVTVPPKVLTKIAVWSLPVSLENVYDAFFVTGTDGIERAWRWSIATNGDYVDDGSRKIITTMGAGTGGKLCF
jgi:hypothetical protein